MVNIELIEELAIRCLMASKLVETDELIDAAPSNNSVPIAVAVAITLTLACASIAITAVAVEDTTEDILTVLIE